MRPLRETLATDVGRDRRAHVLRWLRAQDAPRTAAAVARGCGTSPQWAQGYLPRYEDFGWVRSTLVKTRDGGGPAMRHRWLWEITEAGRDLAAAGPGAGSA